MANWKVMRKNRQTGLVLDTITWSWIGPDDNASALEQAGKRFSVANYEQLSLRRETDYDGYTETVVLDAR